MSLFPSSERKLCFKACDVDVVEAGQCSCVQKYWLRVTICPLCEKKRKKCNCKEEDYFNV